MTEKHRINPLIKSTLLYIIATASGQGMSFLAIIVFTRMMSKGDYGYYSDYYAFVSLFAVLIGANLYYALNNAYIDKPNEIKVFRKSVLCLSAIIAVIVTLLVWIIGTVFLKKVGMFMVLMAAIHSYSFFVVNYRIYSANMENDYRCKSWLLILPNTLQLLFSVVMILAFPSIPLKARIIGSAAAVGVIALVMSVDMLRDRGNVINPTFWKYALKISIPSMLMSISFMIMQQCDKVMITRICGAEETAVYSVIYYLGYALIAVNLAASPVRQAWIYQRLNQRDTQEAKVIQKWYLIMMAGFAILILMLGPAVLKIIAPASYQRYEYIVPFVVGASMMLLYVFYTEIILFFKRNICLSLCVLVAAVVNVILNALMIPRFGAVAACYTTAFSYLLLFILTGAVANRLYANVYSPGWFLLFIVWVLAAAGIAFLFDIASPFRYILYMIALMMLGAYTLHNRRQWQMILKKGESNE